MTNRFYVLVATSMIAFGALLSWFLPNYNVWLSSKSGEAVLAEAEFSRRARVAEAQAKVDAAQLEADAILIRARGQAQANKILEPTLSSPVLQARYLEILEDKGQGDRTVIYVPISPETGLPVGLPITESMRLQSSK